MKQKAVSILTTALLIFAVLAVCIGAATLGRDEGKTSHVHSFRTVSTTATCTEGGIRTERCVSCGQERTIADEPLGHTFVDRVCACGEREIVLISFFIDGTTYHAEEGMTWREWSHGSEYNSTTASWREHDGEIHLHWSADEWDVLCYDEGFSIFVAMDEIIEAQHEYYTFNSVAGGSN